VRGALVVLGEVIKDEEDEITSRVKRLSKGGADWVFTSLPSLSCGGIAEASAIAVEESGSAAGQVLLLGGCDEEGAALSTVHLVDLATGACTPQPPLITSRNAFTAVRLPDGRTACTGGHGSLASAEVWGPPGSHGSLASAEVWGSWGSGESSAAWTWTQLPSMSVGRSRCCGCVMSDGRFAVLGGWADGIAYTSSCETLLVNEEVHWTSLPPMHHARSSFVCAAVARCIIVAGGLNTTSAEVYDEALNRWIRLPCDFPSSSCRAGICSTLL